MEGDLYDLANDSMDHAGHWKPSLMMYFRPEPVDMKEIEGEDLESEEGRKEGGICERDQGKHASRGLGEKIASRIADRIGQRAGELLATLKEG